MTYYHGYESSPFIFSGFDLWSPGRLQLIQLVDFVLQQMWGLPRAPADRTALAPNPAGVARLAPLHGPLRGNRSGQGQRSRVR